MVLFVCAVILNQKHLISHDPKLAMSALFLNGTGDDPHNEVRKKWVWSTPYTVRNRKGKKKAGGVISSVIHRPERHSRSESWGIEATPSCSKKSFLITLPEGMRLQMKTGKIPFMAICWVCCCSESSLSGISRNTEKAAYTLETDGSLCLQITEPGPGQRSVLCRICSRV